MAQLGALEEDLSLLAESGLGAWRLLGLRLPTVSRLPAVEQRRRDPGPDSIFDAVEEALLAAVATIENPWRAAATAHFGLDDDTKGVSAKTNRENIASERLGYPVSRPGFDGDF